MNDCCEVDRAGRNESLDELAKRHGGTAKKASSAKKQRARKVHMVMTSSNSKIITTTRGDIICVAGPGAVDQAFLNKAVSRGRLVLSVLSIASCSSSVGLTWRLTPMTKNQTATTQWLRMQSCEARRLRMQPCEARGSEPPACSRL